MKKLTFKELCDKLEDDENLNGVIVFKQNRSWKEEYSLEDENNPDYNNPFITRIIIMGKISVNSIIPNPHAILHGFPLNILFQNNMFIMV